MDKRENGGEQDGIEINIVAEEEFNDGQPEQAEPEGEIMVDFGDAVDSIVEDIKSDSLYSLKSEDAEELDLGEDASDAVVDVDDVAGAARESADDSAGPEPDELAESITITTEEAVHFEPEQDDEYELERARASKRRLRRVLLFFVIVLVALAAVMALFIWRNSTPPDIKPSDSDVLQTSAAGTNTTQFQPVDAEQLPNLVSYFGMTPEQAVEAGGGIITLDAATAPASDPALPSVVATRNAWVMAPSGGTLASITFGLDAEQHINYVFASFDLDSYGVADAKFDELVASNIVAASVLEGIGIDSAAVDAAQLTITDSPQAIIARDTSGQEVAEFSGSTNIAGVPSTWKVTETYDHATGVTLGDNSVIRTLSVDLR